MSNDRRSNVKPYRVEKRKFPRIDTRDSESCRIKVYGVPGKPLVGKVVNISLGGVAFVSHYRNIAKAIKKPNTKVEIHLPNGRSVDALTSLLRVRPQSESDDCLCVLKLTEINGKNSSRLARFISH